MLMKKTDTDDKQLQVVETKSGRELVSPRKRPEVILGKTRKVRTGCGSLYVTLNWDKKGNLFEVFVRHGKTGGCGSAQMEALGIVISKTLRSGVDPHSLSRGIKEIRCPSPLQVGGEVSFSCADAMAKVIEEYLGQVER